MRRGSTSRRGSMAASASVRWIAARTSPPGQILVTIDNPELLTRLKEAQAAQAVALADLKRIHVGTRAEVVADARLRWRRPRPTLSSPNRPTTAPSSSPRATSPRCKARRGDRHARRGETQLRSRPSSPSRRRSRLHGRGKRRGPGRRRQGGRGDRDAQGPGRRADGQSADGRAGLSEGAEVGESCRPACRCSRWSTFGCLAALRPARGSGQGLKVGDRFEVRAPALGDKPIDGGGPQHRHARRVCRMARHARDRRLRPQDLRGPRLSRRRLPRAAARHERLRRLEERALMPASAARHCRCRGARIRLDLARPRRPAACRSASRCSPSPCCRSPSAMPSSAISGSTSSTRTTRRRR